MLRNLFAVLFFSTIVAGHGQAFANEDLSDNELFVEVQVTAYAAKHSGDNLLGKNLYVEKPINEDGLSVFGVVYHDEEFHEAQVGLAKKITDELQVGLGVGAAVYDGKTHGVVRSVGVLRQGHDSCPRHGRSLLEWLQAVRKSLGAKGHHRNGVCWRLLREQYRCRATRRGESVRQRKDVGGRSRSRQRGRKDVNRYFYHVLRCQRAHHRCALFSILQSHHPPCAQTSFRFYLL